MAVDDPDMNARPRRNSGFSMIEVLVSMIIILVALLGIAALQGRAQVAELEAQQRAMALILLSDISDRMTANKQTLTCFTVTDDTVAGTPYIGVAGDDDALLTACAASTAAYNTLADTALSDIDDLLEGAAETAGGANVGGMIGARACISYNSGTELTGQPGTGLFTVAVSWQGMADLVAPAVNCAKDMYGTEEKRRTVSTTFRMADLL